MTQSSIRLSALLDIPLSDRWKLSKGLAENMLQRSWDEFHRCASAALAGCPEEAAVVWESLRQESRKMQFSGNLYDMCSNRAKPSTSVQSPNQEETNQESLRGSAYLPGPAHFLALSLAALVVRM
ncbi:UNVERIFIED_CONTAM: hypothetical protein FKN15_064361 [Acipenser sinensis]